MTERTQQSEERLSFRGLAEQLAVTLGDRLEAVYRFGSDFARGPRRSRGRLLVLVKKLEAPVLSIAQDLSKEARAQNIVLRFDTTENIERSVDVFPVFSLDLIGTRELLQGDDVLASLEVHPEHLRLNVEHSLRKVHRDLLQLYLNEADPRVLSAELRRNARRLILLLDAVLIVLGKEPPSPPTPREILEAVCKAVATPEHTQIWERLRRFAEFEEQLDSKKVSALYVDLFGALCAMIDIVDAHV